MGTTHGSRRSEGERGEEKLDEGKCQRLVRRSVHIPQTSMGSDLNLGHAPNRRTCSTREWLRYDNHWYLKDRSLSKVLDKSER